MSQRDAPAPAREKEKEQEQADKAGVGPSHDVAWLICFSNNGHFLRFLLSHLNKAFCEMAYRPGVLTPNEPMMVDMHIFHEIIQRVVAQVADDPDLLRFNILYMLNCLASAKAALADPDLDLPAMPGLGRVLPIPADKAKGFYDALEAAGLDLRDTRLTSEGFLKAVAQHRRNW